MKKIVFIIFCFGLVKLTFSQIFNLQDSIQLSQANIWGVVFDDGDSLGITTTQTIAGMPHIFLRKIDYNNISQQSALKQLTFDTDFIGLTHLTDHKTIVLNNELYISFSTVGDQDLFLFKTDINGNRIGSIQTVISGSSDPTNDMILTTDGNSIYVLHFAPPDQHHVYQFDSNLNPIGTSFVTTTLSHNNIGSAVYNNMEFHLFTGQLFGLNSGLLHTTWQSNWQPLTTNVIVPSTGGDGNWFSTGAVYDTINNRWYIAMSHLDAGGSLGQEHIDLLAFDNNFTLLERIHVTNAGYYRPHLVLHSNNLYLSYDSGGPAVYLHKYAISNSVNISENKRPDNRKVFPNPANNTIWIEGGINKDENIVIYDVLGEAIEELDNQNSVIDISGLVSGIYFIKIGDQPPLKFMVQF